MQRKPELNFRLLFYDGFDGRGEFGKIADFDVAEEDLGAFGLELDLSSGEGGWAVLGDFLSVVEDHGGSAIDGVNHGVVDRVDFDAVPFSVGLFTRFLHNKSISSKGTRIMKLILREIVFRFDHAVDEGSGARDGIEKAHVLLQDLAFEGSLPCIPECSVFADAME